MHTYTHILTYKDAHIHNHIYIYENIHKHTCIHAYIYTYLQKYPRV